MMGWIGMKMATNWAWWMKDDQKREKLLPLVPSGFIGSLISMGFAYLGGLICHGDIQF
jgi:hypothetical protein